MTLQQTEFTSGPASYDALVARVRKALAPSGRKVVVFDADGTLWRGDLGEAHLKELGPDSSGPVSDPEMSAHQRYLDACKEDVERGYRLGTQILAPRSKDVVYQTCDTAWEKHRCEQFSYVAPLFKEIESLGGEVWIVSASHRWIIEVAVRELSIPANRVIAGDLECDEDNLTSRIIEPFPNGVGKAQAIKARIDAVPRMAFGNSRHDLPMLECAEDAALIWDNSSKPESLLTHGLDRGWVVYEGRVEASTESSVREV